MKTPVSGRRHTCPFGLSRIYPFGLSRIYPFGLSYFYPFGLSHTYPFGLSLSKPHPFDKLRTNGMGQSLHTNLPIRSYRPLPRQRRLLPL